MTQLLIYTGAGESVDLHTRTSTPWETEQVSSYKKSLALWFSQADTNTCDEFSGL